jgi:hypothetical protein
MSEPSSTHAGPAPGPPGPTGLGNGMDHARADRQPTGAVTGHPVVDEVLASLAELDDLPVTEHVTVFEAAHRRLRDALAEPTVDTHPEPVVDAPVPQPSSTGRH